MMNRWFALALIGISVLFSLSLWFSTSVIEAELKIRWGLSTSMEACLVIAVPIGFVLGAFFSALFGLADFFNTRKSFAMSALLGALLNLSLIFVEQGYIGIFIRILTGVSLAGIYPPAIKLVAEWFTMHRGVATGVIIAALTFGTSLPHLLALFSSFLQADTILIACSALTLLASLLILFVLPDSPKSNPAKSPFSLRLVKEVLKNRPVMLVNFGYFGHMWELYAMWTWLPIFLTSSFLAYSPSMNVWVSTLVAFLSIGLVGALGCVLGGLASDKIGRANVTIIAMAVSGLSSLLIGFTYGQSIFFTIFLSLIWGMFINADSAQFSAAVTEFAKDRYKGTALTFQLCVGFLLTIISINILPTLESLVGWRWVFVFLSLGPFMGIIAMLQFRKYENSQLAEVE